MVSITQSLKTILITASIAFMTGCGGGGGGGSNVQPTPIITWTNGIYDPWALTTTDAQSSTNASCTVDIYIQNVWWEKNIDGVKTGIKGSLIRTDTEELN